MLSLRYLINTYGTWKMYAATLLGLLAGAATSEALKYDVPTSIKATNCPLPANYTVSDFTIYTDTANNTKSATTFSFSDPSTGIETFCSRNSTSKPSATGTNRWPCDNSMVAFIWQTTGIAGLTMIEQACPGRSVPYLPLPPFYPISPIVAMPYLTTTTVFPSLKPRA